jgi:prevent-host-death family protein
MAKLGIEVARRRLPELVAAAHRGAVTVITRHGQPYAALVPVRMASGASPGRPAALMALKGRAAGLWGKAPARTIARLRDEWPD